MRRLVLPIATALLLAGCQNTPHYTITVPPPEPSVTHPAQGPQPPRVKPSIPAMPNYTGTAGPLTAKNVGAYMDGLERDLRRILRGTPIARPGDALSIELHNDASFEKDGSLTGDAHDTVQALAAALRHYDHTLIQVNGYTDTKAAPERALQVTRRRAGTVAAELRADGIDDARITVTGFGSDHLKKATGEGISEPRNRRVEIRIIPHPG